MTDPISDFLTRLRNASKARLEECIAPHSRLKESIAAILKAEGYISDYRSGTDERGHKTLIVKMKYVDGGPGHHRARPRVHAGPAALFPLHGDPARPQRPRHLHRLHLERPPQGRRLPPQKAGGELICNVW